MVTNIKLHLNYLSIPGESLVARYNWCQGPVPGRGPAVEKHCTKAFNSLWKCTDRDTFTALYPRLTGDLTALWDKKFNEHPPTPTPTLTLHHKTTPPKSRTSSPHCYTQPEPNVDQPFSLMSRSSWRPLSGGMGTARNRYIQPPIHPSVRTNRPSKKAMCHFPTVHPHNLPPHY